MERDDLSPVDGPNPGGRQPGDCTLTIHDLDRQGRGIGRHQGRIVVVDGALPGEVVGVRLQGQRGGQMQGQLQVLISPSPQRRRPPCILADHCGGCSLQPLTPEGQARWKEEMVRQTLQRIGGLTVPVAPLLTAASDLGYRNRAIIPLERGQDGRLRAGFYRRGSHRIVNMNRCPVLDPRLDALIAPLKADLEARSWPVDRHGTDTGGLRHLALRVGHHSGEVLLTLIASHDRLAGMAELAQTWMRRWPFLVGVTLNLQPQPSNLLFGPYTRALAGRAHLREIFAGLTLQIASDTFFQVHTLQAERVVPLLLQAAGAPTGELVDAYCGIGTYSLPLASKGWRVLALEVHAGSVARAQRNAARNGLEARCRFRCADVAEALPAALAQASVLLLDPPRKGLDGRVLQAILAAPPTRLLYLSCDPATLARDLRLLCAGGYRLCSLQPIDFFPNTTHVECLAVLERSEPADRDGRSS
ncbi:MAG: 23S rRNA (uracil(1939)-C(5))-methyltransferase RlmD [Cyanobium sp.]